jgi:hypothetical protein
MKQRKTRLSLSTWIILTALGASTYAATLPPIQMHSGWVTSQKVPEDNGFMLFRRYGISGNDKNPFPNLIIFNCSKDVNKASHLTFILPNDFPLKSFHRSEWLPKINVRFRIDDKLSVPMPGEYQDGEFYFDLNNDTRDHFEKIMSADKLAIGFGDQNDVIQFEFTEKIDQLFSAVIKELPWMGEFTHYSRTGVGSVIEACEAYQQKFISDQQSVSSGESAVKPPAQGDGAQESEIIDSGIDIFDRLCIEQAYDKNAFLVIEKRAQRKLSSEEYKQFLFGPALSADFYSVPISERVGDVVVGRTSYKEGGHNCVVGFRTDIKLALRRWMNLYNKKYAAKAELKEDKGAPYFLLEQGLFKKLVLVQIANLGNGFVVYYTYFK